MKFYNMRTPSIFLASILALNYIAIETSIADSMPCEHKLRGGGEKESQPEPGSHEGFVIAICRLRV